MPAANPVLRNTAYCLAHVPEWVRFGSKPRRELRRDPTLAASLEGALRDFARCVAYPPNQVFVGRLTPAELGRLPRPWFETAPAGPGEVEALRRGPFGEIVGGAFLTALVAHAAGLEPPLVELTHAGAELLGEQLAMHAYFGKARWHERSVADSEVRAHLDAPAEDALPLRVGDTLVGALRRDRRAEGREDENLVTYHLLENLCVKASGALALAALLEREGLEATAIDYLISCGEEAVGDRYQRGGGGMAKAIGELCGCARASGMDVKNFCAAPANALVTAGALVQAGLYERVAVVGGGSLAKLGMKFEAALARGIPVLEDCLASCAFLVTADDGRSPALRLERGAVGVAPIGASATDEAVYRALVLGPLGVLGYPIPAIERFAPELHNSEIMELAGSGDVTHKNFRAIAAMAVVAGQLERDQMKEFLARVETPGFAPTQGHIPSAVADLGHARAAILRGEVERAFFVAKASLFLGRCTDLYDGVSFLLEANPAAVSDADG